MLGNLVRRHKTKLEQVFVPKKRVELTFYKNSIIHWFVSDGVVAIALYAALKPHLASPHPAPTDPSATPTNQPKTAGHLTVSKRDLLEHVKFVSQLLKLVFISNFFAFRSLFFSFRSLFSLFFLFFKQFFFYLYLYRNLFISHRRISPRTLRSRWIR